MLSGSQVAALLTLLAPKMSFGPLVLISPREWITLTINTQLYELPEVSFLVSSYALMTIHKDGSIFLQNKVDT